VNAGHPMMRNILSLAERSTWQHSIEVGEASLAAWSAARGTVRFDRVYLLGCGTSFYAGQVAKYAVEHIAHTPAEAVQAFAFAAYAEPAVLGPRTLVVGISTTGNTQAVCDALARAREAGAPTLGITANTEANIARIADAVIPTGGQVTLSVKTRTYVQSLVTVYLLALALAGGQGKSKADLNATWRRQIELAAEATRHFFDHQQAEVEHLAKLYAKAPKVFVLGTGPNAGTAEEASLKVIEMAKMFSEAQELEDFLHGRLREVDQFTPMVFVAPQGRGSARTLDFLTVTDYVGAPSVVLTDEVTPGIERLATHVIPMQGGLDEFATPLAYIVPLYLLGYHLALQRGYDPAARRYPDIVPQNMRYGDPVPAPKAGPGGEEKQNGL
jgi:glucosamine--fructose-6-phosphate aminotransferase (isomerizing)